MKLRLSNSPFGETSGGIIRLSIWYEEDFGVYMSDSAKDMEIGMLWKGEEGQRVFEIVADAMKHYITKYGTQPDLVYMNKEMYRVANQEHREQLRKVNRPIPNEELVTFSFIGEHRSTIVVEDTWQNGHIWIGVSR